MAFQCTVCLSADFTQFNALNCGHILHADCLNKLRESVEEQDLKCPVCRAEISSDDSEITKIQLSSLDLKLESLTLSSSERDQAMTHEDPEKAYQKELEKAKMEMKATCENLENVLTQNLVALNSLKNLKAELIRESSIEVATEIGERVYGNLLSYLQMERPNASEDHLPPNVFQMNESAIDNYMESFRNIRTAFAELKEIDLD